MIIKKYTASTTFSGIFSHLRVGHYAFALGTAILLAIITLLLLWQNRLNITPSGHFFSQATDVSVSRLIPWPYQTIRYTTDGSTPTAQSPILQSPLSIEKTTMLQIATFAGENRISNIQTHPIFIGANHELPILSIVTDEENLFDPEHGIYTNFEKDGDDWERPAQLTFFEPDGRIGFQKNIGIRIHGKGTATFPQKPFRIYAGYQNHSDQIKYPLFPELPYNTFNNFILRPGGGDWTAAYMRDAVMQELASQATELETQAVRPSVVYINNEYWGLYYIQERIDQNYLANKYGLSKDKLSIVEVPLDNGDNRGKVVSVYGNNTAATEYNRMFDESLSDCKGCPNYSDFTPVIDMDSFIDYLILEFYSGNFDWPFGNIKLWRYEQPTKASEEEKSAIDGRLRWIFFDLDVTLAYTKTSEEEVISSAQNRVFNSLADERFPFRNLIYSQKFRREFIRRATELLNTHMSEQNIIDIIDRRAASIRSEMPQQIQRWKDHQSTSGVKTVASMEDWEKNVQLLKLYAQYRTKDFFNDTVELYEQPGLTEITFTSSPPEAGGVSIDAITKSDLTQPWNGTFFKDTISVVQAHPNDGYVFDHWEGDIPAGNKYNDSAQLILGDQKNITAVFREKKWYEYIYSK